MTEIIFNSSSERAEIVAKYLGINIKEIERRMSREYLSRRIDLIESIFETDRNSFLKENAKLFAGKYTNNNILKIKNAIQTSKLVNSYIFQFNKFPLLNLDYATSNNSNLPFKQYRIDLINEENKRKNSREYNKKKGNIFDCLCFGKKIKVLIKRIPEESNLNLIANKSMSNMLERENMSKELYKNNNTTGFFSNSNKNSNKNMRNNTYVSDKGNIGDSNRNINDNSFNQNLILNLNKAKSPEKEYSIHYKKNFVSTGPFIYKSPIKRFNRSEILENHKLNFSKIDSEEIHIPPKSEKRLNKINLDNLENFNSTAKFISDKKLNLNSNNNLSFKLEKIDFPFFKKTKIFTFFLTNDISKVLVYFQKTCHDDYILHSFTFALDKNAFVKDFNFYDFAIRTNYSQILKSKKIKFPILLNGNTFVPSLIYIRAGEEKNFGLLEEPINTPLILSQLVPFDFVDNFSAVERLNKKIIEETFEICKKLNYEAMIINLLFSYDKKEISSLIKYYLDLCKTDNFFNNIYFILNATEEQFEYYLSTNELTILFQNANIKTNIINI